MIRCFCVALLVACFLPFAATAQVGPPQDRYIVVLSDGLDLPEDVAADVAQRTGGRIGYVYEHALRGFSITMPRAALNGVVRDPRVAHVEEDIPVRTFAQEVPTGVMRIFADGNSNITIDGVDDWRVDVDVAVIDTGIDVDHPELDVVGGANCLQSDDRGPPWARTYYCDDSVSFDDDHYHGTHVAGTIGAIDNGAGVVGVAPGARLWAVKVLDSSGSGYMSGIVAGVECVIAPTATCSLGDIEVINMSLGGSGTSPAMDTAIATAVDAGITVVVAAGNSNQDAGGHTPANSPDAITVSALADFDGKSGGTGLPTCRDDQDDTLADFSNWGETIEIAAPGVCILSTYPIEQGSYGTISGTSMAAPHVAGAAALLASGDAPPTNRDGVVAIRDTLFVDNGNFVWTDDSGDGIKEPLLDISNTTDFAPALVAGGGGDGGDANGAPTASFSHDPCVVDTECQFYDESSDDGTLSWAWDFDGDATTIESEIQNPTYTFTTGGGASVTLTVTDNDGNSDSVTKTVSVSDGSSMHVGDLDGSAVKNGPSWSATVTITIHDGDEKPVADATVSGTWSPVGTSEPCTTDQNGVCTTTATGLPNNAKSIDFTVDNEGVTHATLGHDETANHDPDGDSNGTIITVDRP